ncbi:anti-sigma-F factor Fin [Tenuibacillus multivorans]|uniref:Anti-sigma-F factor Fin n=1 Tax=Tenuibacillus multivorans TaxID=237069 RepID=A0A1G9VZA3_9BACI|nr:anti-sigma-F factor Fin [Tenuibacillus multivorans]GEL78257.1 hypothetical protein TMU01_24920 [Tenuibacillus multivorans]SDM77619.1 Protein of unknown function [Tenuibacillus multivorans]
MAVQMKCRHCQQSMGSIEDEHRVYDIIAQQPLSVEEQHDLMTENEEGQKTLNVVCEHCEEILTQNPNLFENDTFIH